LGDLVVADLYNPGNEEWVTPSIANAVKAIPTNLTAPGQNIMNSGIEGAYPIARLLFYLINRNHLSENTITYVSWCLVQGQKFVSVVGYVPINGTAAQSYSLNIMSALSPSP
jgi:ABC-type phosphate transport system substrate-binding protein